VSETPAPTVLLWFAAGVMVVIGVIRRGSKSDGVPDEAL